MMQASPYAIALSHFAPFGSRTYRELLAHFQTYENLWNASLEELTTLKLAANKATAFVAWRRTINPQHLADDVAALDIKTLDRNHPHFPAALNTIHDPPIVLYVRGAVPVTDQLVGIVGAREATDYGRLTAQQFASELARAGLVVVSGLARGIDTEAHTAAMSVGGKTVAVLAHGLEQLERGKRELAQQIVACGGAIMSEQPPYLEAQKFHFPIRNRIIAGLSKAVLVVEAKLPSGSLTTAKSALENARDIFAVPGNINSPMSAGTNKLLQDGAQVATCPNDILLAFNLRAQPAPAPLLAQTPNEQTLSPEATLITNQLSRTPQHVNDLARASQLPTALVLATLTLLEIRGQVRNLGNMHYSL